MADKNTAKKSVRKPAFFRGFRLDWPFFSKYGWKLVRLVLITGISFLILYPLIVKFSLSIMQERDLYDNTVRYVPKNFTLENYKLVWEHMRYPTAFWNSFKLSTIVSVLQLVSCTLVAYGFARFEFPLKKFWFGLVLLTLIIPQHTIMIPLFMHFRHFDLFGIVAAFRGGESLNLLNSYWPFIFMSITAVGLKNGLYIYIIRQFFRGMPKELEEAAYVDGCGLFRTFLIIMLPSAIPIMITSFLFSFVWQWNDTFYSTLFLQKLEVLPTALSSLALNVNQYLVHVGKMGPAGNLPPSYISMLNNTGSIMVILPLIVIYVFAQRYFVESIERSGIVG